MQKFSKWTVLEAVGTTWLCRCECGTTRRVNRNDLRHGRSKSCGCSRSADADGRQRAAVTTHGMEGTPTYRTWVDMRRRCHNPNRPDFKNYGARGISVCPEWRESFAAFLRDMGERPEGHTLDRLNNSGNYDKRNCVWAPRKMQERNKRTNRIIEVGGNRMTFVEACEVYGINYYTAYNRFRTLGWTIDDVFKRPIRGARP